MKKKLTLKSSLDSCTNFGQNLRHSSHKKYQQSASLPLSFHLLAEIIGFLDPQQAKELRQISTVFKSKVVPNAYQEVVID